MGNDLKYVDKDVVKVSQGCMAGGLADGMTKGVVEGVAGVGTTRYKLSLLNT